MAFVATVEFKWASIPNSAPCVPMFGDNWLTGGYCRESSPPAVEQMVPVRCPKRLRGKGGELHSLGRKSFVNQVVISSSIALKFRFARAGSKDEDMESLERLYFECENQGISVLYKNDDVPPAPWAALHLRKQKESAKCVQCMTQMLPCKAEQIDSIVRHFKVILATV